MRKMLSLRASALVAVVAAATACQVETRDDQGFGSGAGGDGGLPQGTGSDTGIDPYGDSGGSETGGDADDGSDIKLDVAAPGSGGAGDDGGAGMGCDKVDFVFVIDNSGSMEDEQANLIGSFDGFMSTVESTLEANDFHILVTDSDEGGTGSSVISCTPDCCAQACADNPTAICNGNPCTPTGDECDTTLGAGRSTDLEGDSCAFATGKRFMDSTEPNLLGAFDCAARVGVNGDGNERPMEAMLEAVSSDLNAGGQCNEDFLRDDAILVVTFITDEEDLDKSPGSPATWKNDLVIRKNGNEEAVVVLGILGDSGMPGGLCPPYDQGGAEDAPQLRSFVESFSQGSWASICEPDYTPFFVEAVSVIDTACDNFEPEG